MRKILLLLPLLCLLLRLEVAAQTFANPSSNANDIMIGNNTVGYKKVNNSSDPIIIPASGNISLNCDVYVYRSKGTPTQGYLDFRLGTSSTNLASGTPLVRVTVNSGDYQNFNAGWEYAHVTASFSISAAGAANYTAFYVGYYNNIGGPQNPPLVTVSDPVYYRVDNPTTQPPSQPAPWALSSVRLTSQLNGTSTVSTANNNKLFAFVGAQLSVNGTGTELYKLMYVQFQATNLPFSTTPNSVATTGTFPAPARGYYYLSFVGANKGDTYGVQVIRPRSDFFPCGNSTICYDQCIPNGSTPALLTGRLLATPSSDYEDYDEYLTYTGDTRWASKDESESVQWQSHLDGENWQDISGATSRNYQPGPQTYTTYYRRVSTHLEGKFQVRRFWYNSNEIIVQVQAAVPQVSQSNYTVSACGSGTSTLALSLNPGAYHYAQSWNWDAPYAGWTIGDASNSPRQTGPGYGSFVTQFENVTLNVPTTTPPGTYAVTVSGNGGCGSKSGDATIYVTVASGTPPGGVSRIDFQQNNSTSDCTYLFDVYTDIVPGVDSYYILLGNGQQVAGDIQAQYNQVYFPLSIQATNGTTVTVTSVNSCGTTNVTSQPQYYPAGNSGDPNCIRGNPIMETSMSKGSVDQLEVGAYPNPAHDVLTVVAFERPAVATFYDAQGVAQLTVRLSPHQTSLVNVLELPAGLYHLRVVADSQELLERQIIIRH